MSSYQNRKPFSTVTMRLVSYKRNQGWLTLTLKDALGTVTHEVPVSWGNDFRALGITCHDELPLAIDREVQVAFCGNLIPKLVAPQLPPSGADLEERFQETLRQKRRQEVERRERRQEAERRAKMGTPYFYLKPEPTGETDYPPPLGLLSPRGCDRAAFPWMVDQDGNELKPRKRYPGR